MGSFERLGILVIVVIIVMILAVAIYQWGATGVDPGATVLPHIAGKPETLIVDYDKPTPPPIDERKPALAPIVDTWANGMPKTYIIKDDDIVWKLVVKRWRLKESFIDAIKRANPGLNMKRLRAGNRLMIPDPTKYRPETKQKPSRRPRTRSYEIQEGDLLETIARNHLGRKSRWKEILRLNPGINPKNLKLGDTIQLPLK